MGKRESGIQSRTVQAILTRFTGACVRVKHGTPFAVVGDPDVYGCCPQLRGRMFAFEIKNEDGELTRIQIRRLREFQMAGALTAPITEPSEAIALILQASKRGL